MPGGIVNRIGIVMKKMIITVFAIAVVICLAYYIVAKNNKRISQHRSSDMDMTFSIPKIIISEIKDTVLEYETLSSWKSGKYLFFLDSKQKKIHVLHLDDNTWTTVNHDIAFKVEKILVCENKILFIEKINPEIQQKSISPNIVVAEFDEQARITFRPATRGSFTGEMLCQSFGENNEIGYRCIGSGGFIENDKFHIPYTAEASFYGITGKSQWVKPGPVSLGFLTIDVNTLEVGAKLLDTAMDNCMFSVIVGRFTKYGIIRQQSKKIFLLEDKKAQWSKPEIITDNILRFISAKEHNFDVSGDAFHVVWLKAKISNPYEYGDVAYKAKNYKTGQWSEEQIISNGKACCDPAITVEGDNIVVAWWEMATPELGIASSGDIVYTVSNDKGKTWSNPLRITDYAKVENQMNQSPKILLYNNVLHLVYMQGTNNNISLGLGTQIKPTKWSIVYQQKRL